jgi:hypothetical protein
VSVAYPPIEHTFWIWKVQAQIVSFPVARREAGNRLKISKLAKAFATECNREDHKSQPSSTETAPIKPNTWGWQWTARAGPIRFAYSTLRNSAKLRFLQ